MWPKYESWGHTNNKIMWPKYESWAHTNNKITLPTYESCGLIGTIKKSGFGSRNNQGSG